MDRLDQTTLEHVRLRGAPGDAAVARLRLSHLLTTADLRPPAMPPSAILVVRSMADPLPGCIAVGPWAAPSAEWERAARIRLGELYARSARPAWGPVSSGAEAVLFADYGELMACLAADVSSESAGAWWWRSLLKRYRPQLPNSWVSFWGEHPKYIPSALQHLEARGKTFAVMERIAPAEAVRLLAEVAHAFALPRSLIPHAEPAGAFRMAGRKIRREYSFPLPWEPHIPPSATPAALGAERRALVGIGLLLCRAPAVALTSGFSVRFSDWIHRMEVTNPVEIANPTEAANAEEDMRAPKVQPLQVSPGIRALDEVRPGDPPPAEESFSPRVVAGRERRNRSWKEGPAALPVGEVEARRGDIAMSSPKAGFPIESSLPSSVESGLPERQVTSNDGRPVERRSVEPTTEESHSAVRRGWRLNWESGVVTRLGGILYLIHLLRQMDLMRQFETGLSGWALLELFGRCLISPSQGILMDPIWDALAELDDRDPGTTLGAGFVPQPTYTAPDTWVRHLEDAPRLMRVRTRGVELWRPEGFLVLDSLETRNREVGELVAFRRRERRRFRQAAQVRPAGITVSRDLRRFLHFVLPYARWRLGKALLGITPEEALLRQGRLVVSSSHVDLVMGLGQISVPVRLAGLDANPGWVPELGRVATFYFVAERMDA